MIIFVEKFFKGKKVKKLAPLRFHCCCAIIAFALSLPLPLK